MKCPNCNQEYVPGSKERAEKVRAYISELLEAERKKGQYFDEEERVYKFRHPDLKINYKHELVEHENT